MQQRMFNRKWISAWLLLALMVLLLGACRSGDGTNTPDSGSTAAPHEQEQQGESSSPPAGNDEEQEGGSDQGNDAAADSDEPADPAVTAAETQLAGMTTEQKIGQLVMVGIDGTRMDDVARSMVREHHVGGFIFFKDNIESTAQAVSLLNELKRENADAGNPAPLWLSIDEEGGRVTRFPDEYAKLPSSGAVGSANDPALTERIGGFIGRKVNSVGMNMVYAPVLDVNSNPDNPVIGDRSFGDQAQQVIRHGVASMKGIQDAGVVPVVKHFPGHGDTSVDSHLGLPVIEHDKERLSEVELAPFRQAIEEGAEVVMVGHLLMKSVDPDTPSSYSKAVITDLLRGELGFQGVVITDDMTMGAITASTDIGDASVRSIAAGSNIVLVGHDYAQEQAVIQALGEAVEAGDITEEMLNDRVLPILTLKQRYRLKDMPVNVPDIAELNKEIRAAGQHLK